MTASGLTPILPARGPLGGPIGASPFRTGISTFSPGVAKLTVPMVFVYSPALLFVIEDHVNWYDNFSIALTCAAGPFMAAAALAGDFLSDFLGPARICMALAGAMPVAPGTIPDLYALGCFLPVLAYQLIVRKRAAQYVAGAT